MPSGFANMTGGARYPPRLSWEGKLELTKAPRSLDRGCGNSRRLPPGEARADRSGRSVSETRRHPFPAPFPREKAAPLRGKGSAESCVLSAELWRAGRTRKARGGAGWSGLSRLFGLSGLFRFSNQRNQIDRIHQIDQTDQMNQIDSMTSQLALQSASLNRGPRCARAATVSLHPRVSALRDCIA